MDMYRKFDNSETLHITVTHLFLSITDSEIAEYGSFCEDLTPNVTCIAHELYA